MLDWIHELVGNAPWLPAALWVITIIVALGFLLRWIGRTWPKLRRFVKTMDSLVGLPEFIERTDDSVAQLKQQILNSHGDINMRDEITEALDSSKRAEAMLAEVQTKLANDNTRIIELQSRDELGRFTKKEE